MITVTGKDLVELGYGTSLSADIVKKAEELIITRGHTYYQSRKLGRIPREVAEKILGIRFSNENKFEQFLHSKE